MIPLTDGSGKEAVLVDFCSGRKVDILVWSLTSGNWYLIPGDRGEFLRDGNWKLIFIDLK